MRRRKSSHSHQHQRTILTMTKSEGFWYISALVILMSMALYMYSHSTKPEIVGVKTEKINEQNNTFLQESGSVEESRSEEWWLNSGGKVFIEENSIKTIQGELPTNDRWRKEYTSSNPLDTDEGYHPQNIFRLVTRNEWQNLSQQVYFKINKDNLSRSLNRDRWSGVFLFNRYQDGNNLYYTGVRTDGAVVIKKKTDGVYYTMAYKKIYPGIHHRINSPNLLPHNSWVGLKSEVENLPNGSVSIKLYLDEYRTGKWGVVLETLDRPGRYGGPVISSPGSGGIRTDFMDVEFDNYRIEKANSD